MYFRFPTAGICENLFEGTETAFLETVTQHVAARKEYFVSYLSVVCIFVEVYSFDCTY